MVDRLFYVARADGVVTGDEVAYLERVAELFGLTPLNFRRLKAEHMGSGPDDPYRVIGVPHDAPEDIVRRAWKQGAGPESPGSGRRRRPAARSDRGRGASPRRRLMWPMTKFCAKGASWPLEPSPQSGASN